MALAVIRSDTPDGGADLPCGKIDPGETAAEAAVREALEETGLQVVIEGEPFIMGNTSIFPARVTGGSLRAEEGKGAPAWVEPSWLTRGVFGGYNRRMLAHFGVRCP